MMLKDRIDGATVVVPSNFDGITTSEVVYTCLGNVVFEDGVGDTVFPQQRLTHGDPLIAELLELADAVDMVEAAWLCRIDSDGAMIQLLARSGPVSRTEVVDVLASLAGSITFSQASRPFRWLAGGREYVVCAIGSGSAAGTALFLRADPASSATWLQVQRAAARIQRLISLGMAVGGNCAAPALADRAEFSARGLADLCPFGIVVVDINETIVFANLAMNAFFTDSAPIGNLGGKLAIFSSEDAIRVHVALRAVLTAPQGRRVQQTIALNNGHNRPILLAISRLADDADALQACIMVTDAADHKVDVKPLADAFALTPVETRLVVQLAQGCSVQEAAQRLKLKVETVRTYLKQIFQKTGTHRQLELVQLMRAGALPLLA